MRVAFSTDDGNFLKKDHFGEGKFFDIYEIKRGEYNFIERRKNTSREERFHGDPEKARKISEILRDVDVLVGFQMGPNVKKMKERFIVIISRYIEIRKIIEIIMENYDSISEAKGKIVIINQGPRLVFV